MTNHVIVEGIGEIKPFHATYSPIIIQEPSLAQRFEEFVSIMKEAIKAQVEAKSYRWADLYHDYAKQLDKFAQEWQEQNNTIMAQIALEYKADLFLEQTLPANELEIRETIHLTDYELWMQEYADEGDELPKDLLEQEQQEASALMGLAPPSDPISDSIIREYGAGTPEAKIALEASWHGVGLTKEEEPEIHDEEGVMTSAPIQQAQDEFLQPEWVYEIRAEAGSIIGRINSAAKKVRKKYGESMKPETVTALVSLKMKKVFREAIRNLGIAGYRKKEIVAAFLPHVRPGSLSWYWFPRVYQFWLDRELDNLLEECAMLNVKTEQGPNVPRFNHHVDFTTIRQYHEETMKMVESVTVEIAQRQWTPAFNRVYIESVINGADLKEAHQSAVEAWKTTRHPRAIKAGEVVYRRMIQANYSEQRAQRAQTATEIHAGVAISISDAGIKVMSATTGEITLQQWKFARNNISSGSIWVAKQTPKPLKKHWLGILVKKTGLQPRDLAVMAE